MSNVISVENECVEVRVRGRWIAVPAVNVSGRKLIALGTWLRIARVRGEEMMERELGDPEVYLKTLNHNETKKTLRADIFTFTQKLPNIQPVYDYPMEFESVAAIHLISFEAWWNGLPQETRKNVRRSQKRGVQLRITDFDDDLIQGIQEINDETPLRQGMPNGYYGKSFEETKKLYGEFVGRCDFVCAYLGNELLGFLHLVYRGEVASILNLTTKPSHFDKRPANALMAYAIQLCEKKSISYITYGLYNYGNKHDHPLRTFKIRNGFGQVLVPRYFVPLTPWGRVCMRVKLHRGLIGIFPPFVITAFLRARLQWYRLNAFLSRCSSTAEPPNSNRQMERSNPPAGSSS